MTTNTQALLEHKLKNAHDCTIKNFHYDLNESITINLESPKKIKYKLEIREIDKLLINNLREGNIVLDIELYSPHEINKSNTKKLYNEFNIEKYFSDNELIAIEINPSYGASIFCSCKKISFTQEKNNNPQA